MAISLNYGTVQIFESEDKVLGVGAYGKVCKAKCGQLPCAAKLLHDTMFGGGDPGELKFVERFEQECQFLSRIKHPNIVQYLGTFRDLQSRKLALLMELMDESLTRFLEQSAGSIPYHIQLNICHDVALALSYLHSNSIIHRDLSSNNVLLIGGGSRAKVSDFGMSKILDANPRMTPIMTLCPGAQFYMPPEALTIPPHYSSKLDCFSYGVLMVQILTKNFPNPGDAHQRVQDPNLPSQRLFRQIPETERRKKDIDLIEPNHPLLPVALQCLKDDDIDRPIADEICDRLTVLKAEEKYTRQQDTTQDTELANLRQTVEEMARHLEELQGQILAKDNEIHQLRDQKQAHQSLQLPLQLVWRKGVDMPFKSGGYVQSAVVQRKLYVGGGFANSSATNYIVMEYDIITEEWATLPQYRARAFAMVVINNQLVLVGGTEHGDASRALGVWEGMWTYPYPKMPSGRSHCSAVVYKKWLVVAGGHTFEDGMVSVVEVLDIANHQWHVGPSTPVPWRSMKTAIIGSTGYFSGGWISEKALTDKVYCLSIKTLISHITVGVSTTSFSHVWKQIPGLQLITSTPLVIAGSLFAVGGQDKDQVVPTIHHFQPLTEEWVKVGELQLPRFQCTCVMISSSELFVAGGEDINHKYLDVVHIAQIL